MTRLEYNEVLYVDVLPRAADTPRVSRTRGYAVDIDTRDWFFFTAFEPAYAFGRAARMSMQVGTWAIYEACSELRPGKGREPGQWTLYLASAKDLAEMPDCTLLQRFADGARSTSAYWPARA